MEDTAQVATAPLRQVVVYAGFWKRFAATLLDSFWLGILFYLSIKHTFSPLVKDLTEKVKMLGSQISLSNINFPLHGRLKLAMLLLLYAFAFKLYYALWESSKFMATPGKIAMGIKVTDMAGRRITFLSALTRNFSKFLSALAVYTGYMMAGWNEKKQALHDKVAGTVVVRKG